MSRILVQRHIHSSIIWLLFFFLIGCILPGCYSPAPTRQPTVVKMKLPAPTPRPPQPIEPIPLPSPTPPYPTPTKPHIGPVTIVIDPGHGGKDPGAQGLSTLPEKTIVLMIAHELALMLKERGARVYMTRGHDIFVPLDDRADFAERLKADLFISIHADASRKSYNDGATILIARNASTRSKTAARFLKAAFEKASIYCRPIRPQRLRVLEAHSRPSLLVECGFLTNHTDAQNLASPQYRSHLAAALAQGITDYFNR